MRDVRLVVDGLRYGGWKSISVAKGIEMAAGSFTLRVSERWAGQGKPWPISEGSPCRVTIDGINVIGGYVDGVSLEYNSDDHSVAVFGRDAVGALVDCSAALDRWEYRGTSLLSFAAALAEPFGVSVVSAAAEAETVRDKLTIDPGDTAWEALERVCRAAGLLAVSDGDGGVILTRTGTEMAGAALVEGKNILRARADFSAKERYHTYRVLGQHSGSSSMPGVSAAHVRGEATDLGEGRTERLLLLRAESGTTVNYARQRAEWEAIVRAARGDAVSVTVADWGPTPSSLWTPNTLVPIQSPSLGVDGSMLITQVTYTIDASGGTISEIELRRPDAFSPAPTVQLASSGGQGGAWKELTGGV